MTMKVVTPPSAEPITLAEARLHLRVTPDDDSPPWHPDDTLIMAQVAAAREWCENHTKRALALQTVEVVLDEFPASAIQLPMSPIHSITWLKYVDTAGAEQTLSTTLYALDNYQEPGWVVPAVGTTWPATQAVINAVTVRYLAGYDAMYVPLPAAIRAAMLLLLGNWYENREAVVIGTIQSELSFAVEALLLPYRLRLSMA